MNAQIIENFRNLIHYNKELIADFKGKGEMDKVKPIQFGNASMRKGLSIIENYDKEITEGEQLADLKGIGKGIIRRINEILETGKLSEIKTMSQDNSYEIISDLERITGVGPSKAQKLYKDKLTLEIVLQKYEEDDMEFIEKNFTHHQIIGIKYFHDFEKKIPRKEIQSLEKKITKFVTKYDNKYTIHICGSYRRGKPVSGDIDILVTHQDINNNKEYEAGPIHLKNIVKILLDNKILVDHLTMNGYTKYMGVCKNSPKGANRRIDIRFIPLDSIEPALLYFTGSGDFNKNMRTYALKKHYTINEYGIYKTAKSKASGVVKTLKLNANTEKEIFDILNLEYLDPSDRLPSYKFPE
jgi:DNA polymerase beta